MSRIFTVVVLALLSVCICEGANLTDIKWKHDINNLKKLEDALKSKFYYLNNLVIRIILTNKIFLIFKYKSR